MNSGPVLITGVNGFIGTHLAEYFLQKEYDVCGIDRGSVSNNKKIRYYQSDILLDGCRDVLEKEQPQCIIHCAGMADVNLSVKHPDGDFEINVILTRKLLYEIKEYDPDAKLIFLSSAAVYGNPETLPIDETHRLNPISPYALHKMISEEMCVYFSKNYGSKIKILRIFSAYGIGLKKQLFWDMATKYANTGKLQLFGTGRESRDFINIEDLVRAIELVAFSDDSDELVYNVANGEEICISHAAQCFALCVGADDEIVSFNGVTRPGNPINWRADISKLSALGYEKTVSIDEGIRKYTEWLFSTGVLRKG